MGDQQPSAGNDVLDRLRALAAYYEPQPRLLERNVILDAIDEIVSLRDHAAGTDAALKTATNALSGLGAEVAVLRGRRKAAERLMD
jgi:hypothetical protein